jgi:hypothetical protein
MARKIDTKEFIRMARLVHGDKYDYSNSNYTRGKDPITITCRRHGDYIQRASTHLRGSGCPKCFQERNGGIVCGIGINDIGQSDIGLFTTWHGMLFRCYDKKYNSSYSGCEVCDEWKTLSKFAVWYYDNHKEGWQLDKDILGDGKLYSPKTCCFVPSEINMCLVGKDSNGVTFVKGKWQASFSQKYIGRYEHREDAINAYKREKGKHIRSLAEKYGPVLPTRVYDKLKEHALRLCGIEKSIEL